MPNHKNESSKYKPEFDDLISLNDASKICNLSPDHLRRLVRQGNLWGMKIGRNWVTTAEAIQAYIAQEHKPGPKKYSDTNLISGK